MNELPASRPFEPYAITRPAAVLMWYYGLLSLLAGPFFFVALLPLYFKYETLRYRFDEKGISMSWGILFRRETLLTYRRIQDIHLTRNIVQRWMGLATLAIQTASGNASAEISIEGILEAEPLRDFLYAQMRGARAHHDHEVPPPGSGAPPAGGAEPDELLGLLREIRDALARLPARGDRAVSTAIHETGGWIYQGVWAHVIRWLRLPARPPMLPTLPGETAQVFQPSPGWLRYLKFQFWASVIAATVPIVMIEIALLVYYPMTGMLAAFPFLAIDAFFAAIGYLTLHLKYDTTWYVMTSRSLRIRRGVWTVHETTITFENVQNIRIDQGPLERYFGVGNLLVETAGGGGSLSAEQAQAMHQGQFHRGLIEGIDNAPAIRELILPRIRHTDGLGDETEPIREPAVPSREAVRWSSEHLAVLREIRDHSQRLAAVR